MTSAFELSRCTARSDRAAAFVLLADEAVEIGPAPAAQSYLVIDRIIDAARATGAQAIHPGYGFLSENQQFARACAEHGIVFVGPPPDAMAAMGEKVPARERMRNSGVPVVPGTDALGDIEETVAAAARIGYPVLIKASAGGGGIGMRVARDEEELRASFDTAKSTAQRAFGNDTIFLERYLEEPRHIEIQVLADTHGNVIHLGERECSVQRRHQKIVEEAPSPVIDAATRAQMGEAAVTAAKAVGYVNAGTVEFIYRNGEFYFLEMNTRLQVEHPVTELVYGIDLVGEQLRIASGERLSLTPGEGRSARARRRVPDQRGELRARLPAVTGAGDRVPRAGRTRCACRQLAGEPGSRLAQLRPDDRQADHVRADARHGTRPDAPGAAGIRHHRNPHQHRVSPRGDRRPGLSCGRYSTAFIEQHPELVAAADEWAKRQDPLRRVVRDPASVAAIAAAVAVSG